MIIGLERQSGGASLGTVELDANGIATVVVPIPADTATGSWTIWVEGTDRNMHEAGVPIGIMATEP